MLAAADYWRFQPHPEVWFLVGAVVVLGVYAARVIGPKVVEPGQPVVTGRQKLFFFLGVAVLWIASGWPVHDIGEEYLYTVHMFQHLLMMLVVPPLFLLATPEWLARLILGGDGVVSRWLRQLSRPVPAMVLFGAVFALTHWPVVVNATVETPELHYVDHLAVVFASLLVWMPVVSPIKEWRISLPAQMLYLFILSILPTVPTAWMILSETPLYEVYDHGDRLWGISVITDQQAAGLLMKLGGGMYLWTIITALFFRWVLRQQEADRLGRGDSDREVLTFEQVRDAFDQAPAAPDPTPTE